MVHLTRSYTLFLLAGLLSFLVYLQTLAPTITWRNEGDDSGDLAAAVAVGGVPHPPGYPTYLVLGDIFNLLPFGDTAYRLNLLSATSAALAVAVLGFLIHKTLSAATLPEAELKDQSLIYLCALSASLTLAFSNLFWSQAVITEVYTLNLLFGGLLFYGVLQVQPANERWLVPALAGLLGLGLGNHFSILFLVPILFLIKIRGGWRQGLVASLAFVAGLSIYVVIPLRAAASPPINWGLATSWPNFLWLVSAEPYRPLVFTLPWAFIPVRIGAELSLLTQTFMGWGLPVGLLGLHQLFRYRPALATASLITVLLISLYAIGYNTTDSYIYLLPAFFVFAWWLGWGIYRLGKIAGNLLTPRLYTGLMGGIFLLPFLSLGLNFANQDLSRESSAYEYARQSLQNVVPEAIIIAENDAHTFALWYVRYGLGVRPDVAVVNNNLLVYNWYRQTLKQTHNHLHLSDRAGLPATTLSDFIQLNFDQSPIYLTSPQTLTLEGHYLEPLDHLQRVIEFKP